MVCIHYTSYILLHIFTHRLNSSDIYSRPKFSAKFRVYHIFNRYSFSFQYAHSLVKKYVNKLLQYSIIPSYRSTGIGLPLIQWIRTAPKYQQGNVGLYKPERRYIFEI